MKNFLLRQFIMLSRLTFYGLFAQCLMFGVLMASDLEAQKVKPVSDVSLKLKVTQGTLAEVFSEIESTSDFTFSYFRSEIDLSKGVSIKKSRNLKTILLEISRQTDLAFYQVNDVINVRIKARHKDNEAYVREMIFADPVTVTGRITSSEDDEGLPGVNIVLKGTTEGAVTDVNGNYSIDVPSEESILVISSVGFISEEITVGTRTVIDISLTPDIASLQEVIVIGYGTAAKNEVTTTISHLSSDDLLQVAGNGALTAIQGKVAGLSITNTAAADPNSSPNFQLRGVSSRNAGLGPLFVINGVPGGNIDNLNQNDIESIDVLKGGAASAIYGTRGSNGVILITTKKGTNKPQAFYDGYVSFNYLTNRLDVLSHDEFLEHDRGTDFNGNTDWINALTQEPAVSHKQTLQLSGGNDLTNYMISFDYRDAEGLDLRSDKEEYGARLNLRHTSANGLYEATVNIAPRYLKSNQASYNAFNKGITLNPTLPVYDTINPNYYFNIRTGFDGSYNPVEELETVLDGTEGKYLDWSASFRLNILKNLYSQITLGQQTRDFFDFDFTPSYNTGRVNNNNGRNYAARNYNKNDQQSFEWIANYKLYKGAHNVEILGGYSYYYFYSEGLNASNEQFPSDVLTYNNLGSGTWILEDPRDRVGSFKDDSKLIAFFGRVNYDFLDKYYVSASLRREGSSKFGKGNKWGNFPGVSVGWRLTNENFLSSVEVINELKLRADYGVTGNQDFGNYLSLDTYSGYGFYAYQGRYYQVWGPSQNANYDLRWEKSENLNIGVDFEMFDNRFQGSLNYYKRTNNDLLGYYNVPVPPNTQGSTFANVGTMKNSGLEIQLEALPVATNDFNYRVTFAGATNKNEFVSFSNDIFSGQPYSYEAALVGPGVTGVTTQRLEEGKRIGSFYMLKSAGVDEDGKLLVYNQDGEVIPGDEATADDRQYVGNGLPEFTASLGNRFTYKNFELSIFLRGAFGYDIFNTTAFFIGTPATPNGVNILTTAFDGGKYSRLTSSETVSTVSDYFLEKGDFVKVDNITLGYTIESPVKYLNSARIYFTGRNLYTFSKWTAGDPELIGTNGLTPGVNTSLSYYPSSLQLIAGIQLKF